VSGIRVVFLTKFFFSLKTFLHKFDLEGNKKICSPLPFNCSSSEENFGLLLEHAFCSDRVVPWPDEHDCCRNQVTEFFLLLSNYHSLKFGWQSPDTVQGFVMTIWGHNSTHIF
jgi:hypothetical protein